MSAVSTRLTPAQEVALATLSRQGYLGPSTTRLPTVRVLARLGLVTLTGTAGDWLAYPANVEPCAVCGTLEGARWRYGPTGEQAACYLCSGKPDDEPDREPSAEQERAWDEQHDGTSLGA